MSGTLKDRERVTIDQDRCRSATHSLQQSHVDNIPSPFPPRQTPVAGCYGRLTRWKGGGDVVYMALL
ncbi:hypothetical protein MZ16F89_44010 [Escherichia coli]